MIKQEYLKIRRKTMVKPTTVKITQITVAEFGSMSKQIYGLGDDSQVYWWDAGEHIWVLWAS